MWTIIIASTTINVRLLLLYHEQELQKMLQLFEYLMVLALVVLLFVWCSVCIKSCRYRYMKSSRLVNTVFKQVQCYACKLRNFVHYSWVNFSCALCSLTERAFLPVLNCTYFNQFTISLELGITLQIHFHAPT